MFSFFKKLIKPSAPPPPPAGPDLRDLPPAPAADLRTAPPAPAQAPVVAPAVAPAPASIPAPVPPVAAPPLAPAPAPVPVMPSVTPAVTPPPVVAPAAPVPAPASAPQSAPEPAPAQAPTHAPAPMPAPAPIVAPATPSRAPEPVAPPAAPVGVDLRTWRPAPATPKPEAPAAQPAPAGAPAPVYADLRGAMASVAMPMERAEWLGKLSQGLRKTGSSIANVFNTTTIDDALYEELESALLMADAGVAATQWLLDDLKRRVKEGRVTDPQAVKALLADALTTLLQPLERPLVIGEHEPTVIMVVGVNGAGKTTSIGKLTKHLADAEQKVLLAAADTFRAAAREQLTVWAGRNRVEVVSQEGGDPAAVTYDAVVAGRARQCDVVIADTAGRLPTQLHLMEELKKIKRVIAKAQPDAPHEVLLVVDGNTGQNALAQVKSFDEALQVSGLVITKLDGTAKGGVLAAIALWARERSTKQPGLRPLVVYFVGVGEQLADLETFSAREFAQALLD